MTEEKENIIQLCSCCSEKRHQEFQKTFNPKCIKIDGFVKKMFIENKVKEHMWVKVVEIGKDNIKGHLANEPNSIKNLKVWNFVKVYFYEIEGYTERTR